MDRPASNPLIPMTGTSTCLVILGLAVAGVLLLPLLALVIWTANFQQESKS